MKPIILYIHGKGGSASEAEHYAPLFPDHTVMGMDYKAQTPWEAQREFNAFWKEKSLDEKRVILIANSIGAFYAMHAFFGKKIEKAYFISPICDMIKLIEKIMQAAGVSEERLREEKEIPTPFGETLSWEYLSYVRSHPIKWTVPTKILYGEKDSLTDPQTISDFAKHIQADLTVMENGEHWFHTEEQMAFLDDWIKKGD